MRGAREGTRQGAGRHSAQADRRLTSGNVRLALAQLDPRLGAFEQNALRTRELLAEAEADGADLVVFPELHLTGYALGRVEHETSCPVGDLAALAGGELSMLLGFHERNGGRTYNSAAYFERGSLLHVHRKLYLTDYLVWEEGSLFAPGESLRAFDTRLGRMAVLICNDAWQSFLPFLAVQDGARILLVPSNSATVLPEIEPAWRELTRFYARMLEC